MIAVRILALAVLAASDPVTAPVAAAAPAAPAAATPAPATAPRPATSSARPEALQDAGGGAPVDFRCDKMQVLTKPNRTVCIGNVVFRRGPILVCCKRFESVATDKWDLERATCVEDVRSRRGDELMWADRAEYAARAGELVLTGRPLLRRGESVLEGTRITARVGEEQVRIDEPRGRLVNQEGAPPAPTAPKAAAAGPLPATCPLPAAPR